MAQISYQTWSRPLAIRRRLISLCKRILNRRVRLERMKEALIIRRRHQNQPVPTSQLDAIQRMIATNERKFKKLVSKARQMRKELESKEQRLAAEYEILTKQLQVRKGLPEQPNPAVLDELITRQTKGAEKLETRQIFQHQQGLPSLVVAEYLSPWRSQLVEDLKKSGEPYAKEVDSDDSIDSTSIQSINLEKIKNKKVLGLEDLLDQVFAHENTVRYWIRYNQIMTEFIIGFDEAIADD